MATLPDAEYASLALPFVAMVRTVDIMTPTIEDVHALVTLLDPELPRGEDFDGAAVLLSSLIVGPDEKYVAAFARLPLEFVSELATNLRRCGIWSDGHVNANWLDEEYGAIQFWLDLAAAQGQLELTPAAA